jgi:hypothetical protein
MTLRDSHPFLSTLFGANRAGRILYLSIFVLAVPAFGAWNILLPRLRFHADAVRFLLGHGADPGARGNDGHLAREVVEAARAEEKDPQSVRNLDAVAAVLRDATRTR